MRRSWLGVAERSLGASVAASDRQELGQSKQRDNLDPLNNLAVEMTEIAFVAGDEAAASTADRCTEEWSVLPVELDLQFEEDGRQDVDAFEQLVKTGTPRWTFQGDVLASFLNGEITGHRRLPFA